MHDETLSHLFSCASDVNKKEKEEVFTKFIQDISKYAPEPLVETLQHGITVWEASVIHSAGVPKASFQGLLHPVHITLVQPFNDQTRSIGWEHRVKWGKAYMSLKVGGKQQEVDIVKWAVILIQAIWEYSRPIWKI